jgi:hypothetical protein
MGVGKCVALLAPVCAVAVAVACGDTKRSGVLSSDHGGETNGGEPAEPAGGKTSTAEGGAGALPSTNGGESGSGEPAIGRCRDGYSDWLRSSFSFPNGEMLGTADVPSMPWTKVGSLSLEVEMLTGDGRATFSQGVALPYSDARLRFRAHFTGAEQMVTAAFDAGGDGAGGVRVTVDAAGRLLLTEGTTVVGQHEVAPLEIGVDYFVEATFEGETAVVSLARGGFASSVKGKLEATLSTGGLKGTAAGTNAVAELKGGLVSPAIDDLSFARCGVPAPQYTAKFVDAFERDDSTNLGHADVPVTGVWQKKDQDAAGGAVIQSRAVLLETLDTIWADQGGQVSLNGTRVRIAFSTKAPSSWISVYFNKPTTSYLSTDLGFSLGGDENKGLYTRLFAGKKMADTLHPSVHFAAGKKFAAQVDFDSGIAVLTLRSDGFDGPILLVEEERGLLPTVGTLLMLTTASPFEDSGTLVDEIRVETYEP